MDETRRFLRALARAYGGAVIFALPLFMTMEMWALGFTMGRWQMFALLILTLPLLVGLSYHSGFERTFSLKNDVVDAFVAFAVGATTAVAMLYLLGVIDWSMPAGEVLGKVTVQTVPGSIGALLAHSQFGESDDEQKKEREPPSYGGELFLMAAGALFLAFNVAPTEEVLLIAARITPWHALAIALVSITALHAFVYAMEFRGQAAVEPDTPLWQLFLRFTVVGYAIALLLSAYILWTFDRLAGLALLPALLSIVVLALPAAVGAAAARLIL